MSKTKSILMDSGFVHVSISSQPECSHKKKEQNAWYFVEQLSDANLN